jgi:uncharacterized protein DUF4832
MFDWSLLDIPAQRWVEKGYKVAFRFTCVETGRDQPYATPEWVRKAGAKGHFFTPNKGIDANGTHWEPDYDDPVFLAKLSNFLAAAAARYDGNPEVAFIDVGSMGAWGEGHTFPTTGIAYGPATVRRHIDLHAKHFKKTLVAVNDDHSHQGRGLETMFYARDRGLGLRDDSILVQAADKAYHHAYLAPLFAQSAPIILESEHFGNSVKRGAWGDGELYLKAIEEYQASYATVHWYPREFLDQCRDLILRINMRLGYRLQLLEASWPSEVGQGKPFTVGYRWRNAGVAPCLPGGFPALTLKDSKSGIAGLFVDEEFNMRALPTGAPGKAHPVGREVKSLSQASRSLIEFPLPPASILKPGTYDLYVSVGSRTGTPTIALPLDNDDGKRRYLLGKIRIE